MYGQLIGGRLRADIRSAVISRLSSREVTGAEEIVIATTPLDAARKVLATG